MITCAIVEDEPKAMRLLEEYIDRIAGLRLEFACSDAVEALNKIKKVPVDLVFLDINLPALSGLDLADMMATKVIFVTAYSEFALKGYEKNAIDYLLKPISFSRFVQAVQKAEKQIELERQKHSIDPEGPEFAKSGKKILGFKWSDVLYIEAMREYLGIVTDKEKIVVHKRMKDIEEMCLPDFIRIHHSFFVNSRKIRKVEDDLVWVGDQQLPVSSKYKDHFYAFLKDRLL